MAAGTPTMTPAKLVLGQCVLPAYEAVLGDFARFFARAAVPLGGLVAAALLIVVVQPFAVDRSPLLTLGASYLEFVVASGFAWSWYRLLAAADTSAPPSAWGGLRFFGYCFLMLLFSHALLNGFAWIFVLGGAFVVITGSLSLLRRLPRTMAGIAGRPVGALLSIYIIVVFAAHTHAGVPTALVDFLDRGLYVVALMPIARLLLALPAVAMGAQGDVVAGVWRQSRGNGVRLFGGLLMCVLPFEGMLRFVKTMMVEPVWQARYTENMTPLPTQPFGVAEFITSTLEALIVLLATAVLIGYLYFACRQLGGVAALSEETVEEDVLATG